METANTLAFSNSPSLSHSNETLNNQSGGRMIGLSVTALFFAMLFLNAISY